MVSVIFMTLTIFEFCLAVQNLSMAVEDFADLIEELCHESMGDKMKFHYF